jgi:glycine/D-amino acid oxidase-like deaminating enzyme
MEPRVRRVVVVGGGIAGLCVAYFLQKVGVEVQVLEARRVGVVDRRRIESVMRGAGQMLGGWTELDPDSVWCGLRPIAPDGLPIIDRHPRMENVFVAGAYSMLGMTLAAPAAAALAGFVVTGERPAVLSPFGANRF